MKTPADRLALAAAAFEAGFQSEAARKRALDDLNRAYSSLHNKAHDAQITHANSDETLSTDQQARCEFFQINRTPFDLHQVREAHIEIIARWSGAEAAALLRDLIALRAAIKAAEIIRHERPAQEARAEQIRKSIVEIMEARQQSYIEGLELSRHFKNMPVSVNAHIVHGHKGAVFYRYFFYLAGKLTALNVIMAIAQTLEEERAA